jgi:hypothetical protein
MLMKIIGPTFNMMKMMHNILVTLLYFLLHAAESFLRS